MPRKLYDRDYFDRWYRDPRHRVKHDGELQRKVRLAVSLAEYYLGRPVRSVLDVGCGEGQWRAPLLALRPDLQYLGVDASDYVVARYGRHRNIHRVAFADLPDLVERATQRFDGDLDGADLLICADVLHYVPTDELLRGISAFPTLCTGVAFLEMFCRGDQFVGDNVDFVPRTRDWYRRALNRIGFSAVGSNCWLSRDLRGNASVMELG